MSYVKCMVCGNVFLHISNSHLRKHGFTTAEYRQLYPQAPLTSPDVRKKVSLSNSTRLFHRKCSCGRTFETRGSKGRFCQRCSRVNRRLQNNRPKRRNGTFRKNYLEISDGRVNGAVLLEKGISINRSHFFSGAKKPKSEWFDEFDYLVDYLIFNGKIYCGECCSPIIIARENQHYTVPKEPCCKNCGLIYELT